MEKAKKLHCINVFNNEGYKISAYDSDVNCSITFLLQFSEQANALLQYSKSFRPKQNRIRV